MIPRTLSRVNAIFLVGRKASLETATSKEVNRFCYPGGTAANQLLNHKTLQAWLQIGSSRFPSAGQYEGVNMFYYKWLSALLIQVIIRLRLRWQTIKRTASMFVGIWKRLQVHHSLPRRLRVAVFQLIWKALAR